MGKIQKLNEHLANMIAAGEVVERPMGVVKELIENAIDAEASKISIRLEEGGIVLAEVSDNGSGMDSQDAVLAFNRHSTSKISTEQQLWKIGTLGFRGEALPSIASVASVTCLTNNRRESTQVEIAYGQLLSAAKAPANPGTIIAVRDLFQKTPARLKHLKSVQYETSLILDLVQKFALGYPGIAFTLLADQKVLFQSTGNGNLIEIVYLIYGNEIAQKAIEFTGEDYDFKLSGVLILPQFTRSSRYSITTFINQRVVRYPKLQNAVKEGFKRHIPSDRYPIAVMNIETDHQLIDVNVHPSKWEIRLSKEKELLALAISTIENTLQKSMKVNTFVPKTEEKPVYYQQETLDTFQVPVKESEPFTVAEPRTSFVSAVQKQQTEPVPQELKNHEDHNSTDAEPETVDTTQSPENSELKHLRVLAQMHGKYILAEGEKGLYVFDQHASMERIRYEYYQKLLLHDQQGKQPLLFGVVFEGRATLVERLDELNQALLPFDVSLDAITHDQLILREIPLWMNDIDLAVSFEEILDQFIQEKTISPENFRRKVIATLACHSSIRFNQHLSQEEMGKIVSDLALCSQPYHCPHGRPTFMLIEEKTMEKAFLR